MGRPFRFLGWPFLLTRLGHYALPLRGRSALIKMQIIADWLKMKNTKELSPVISVTGAGKVKKKITDFRKMKDVSSEIKKLDIAEAIVSHLGKNGTFVWDQSTGNGNKDAAIYSHESGCLYSISKKNKLFSGFLHKNYSVNSASSEFETVLAAMESECLQKNFTMAHQHFHYNEDNNTLHLPLSRSSMLKCDVNGVIETTNGDEGVFFKIPDSFEPFDYDAGFNNNNESMIQKVLLSGLLFHNNSPIYLDSEEARFLLTIMMYFILFSESMITRPILVFHGQSGSGKSTLLKKLGLILFGSKFRLGFIPRNRRELETDLINNKLCCFDNVDRSWKASLRDVIAGVATGAGIRLRKLFTSSTQISEVPLPIIALTSRNPAFSEQDDDILSRTLIIRLLPTENKVPETKILREVNNFRNDILNEMISKIPAILKALAQAAPISMPKTFRMADFQDFAYKAAFPIFEGIMGESEIGDRLKMVFTKLESSQHDYLTKTPFFYAIDEYVMGEECSSAGITTHELFGKLTKIDKERHFGFSKKCKSVISLGKLMGNNEGGLRARYNYTRSRGTNNIITHFFTQPESGPIEL
jgi:hypothetical protein